MVVASMSCRRSFSVRALRAPDRRFATLRTVRRSSTLCGTRLIAVTDTYRGSCLCGVVSFDVEEFQEQAAHCHCSMCRKFHGAEYATIAGVPRRAFGLVSGEDALQEYEASNGTVRTFCRHCGSSLFFWSPKGDPDVVEVALGVMDGVVPVAPDAHIFVDSATSWTKIADALPRYSKGRQSDEVES